MRCGVASMLAWSFVASACSPPVQPLEFRDTGRPDAQRVDAGPDSAVLDANVDAFGDAGARAGTCRFDRAADLFELDTDPRVFLQGVALAGGPTSFGVVYSRLDPVGTGVNVWFTEIPSASGPPQPRQALTTGTVASTSATITRTTTGWLVAWLGNRDGNVEVYALGSGADGHLASTPTRVTMTPSVAEVSPALASNGTASALAWAEPGMPTTTVVRAIGADGTPIGTPMRVSPMRFSMVPTAFTRSVSGYVVGWADPDGDAVIQTLAADGTALGVPSPLTAQHGTDGTIDAVLSAGGGLIVYGTTLAGTRHDVHAHLVDENALPIYAERVLTIGADQGTGASVTGIGGGFAVAYRRAGTPPMLRLAFYTSLLDDAGHSDLTQVAAMGGPITLRIAADGNLILTWTDLVANTTHVRAARVRCQ